MDKVSDENERLRRKQLLQLAKMASIDSLSLSRRSIPPDVLGQLDRLLDHATQSMREGQEPALLPPTIWDALLILRRTGIRLSELERLEAPSQADHPGCLEQDANGFWWLHISGLKRIVGQNDRLLIPTGSGIREAIHRQYQRIVDMPDPLGEHRLFCGLAVAITMPRALRKLASHLTYQGKPYVIHTCQFRHTLVFNAFVLACPLAHMNSMPSTMYYSHYYPPLFGINYNLW